MVSISNGRLARQNIIHFYCRIVPKYKLREGNEATGKSVTPATPEQAEKAKQALQPNAENIIAERSKVIARLHNESAFGYTVIATKQRLPIDKIENMDAETWSQIYEVAQELMRKFETKLGCRDFQITIRLGSLENIKIIEQEKGIKERGIDTSQFDKYYEKGEIRVILAPK